MNTETIADLIPSPGEPAPVGISTAPVTTPTPSGAPPRRKVGRPKGSTTKRPNSARTAATAAQSAAETALGSDKTKGPGRPTSRETQNEKMEEGLRNFYIGAGAMIHTLGAVTRNVRAIAVGKEMQAQANICARALVSWSEQNAAVRRALEQLTTAGGAALVLSAHTPIIMAVLSPPEVSDGDDLLGSLFSMFSTDGPTPAAG